MLQTEFRPMMEDAIALCRRRFSDALRTIYLGGSVGAGDALPGVSDIDWFCFLGREPVESDAEWSQQVQRELHDRYPVAAVDFHMNVFSVERLRQERFWRFICRYNAVRVFGVDLMTELEHEGIATAAPSPQLARSRRGFVALCLEQALAGTTPAALATLPSEPFLATRKLARNFVVVEGAFLLMVDGEFVSFQQEQVLAQLKRSHQRWHDLFTLTEKVLMHPLEARVHPNDYMKQCAPFVTFIIDKLAT